MNCNRSKKAIAATAVFGILVCTMVTYLSYPSASGLPTYLRRILHEEPEEEEEEEINETLLSTCITVIVLILILLTVAFEECKEYIEEAGGRKMKPIVDSLFGEMTILGFLSAVTFVVTKCGVFSTISSALFGEEEEELLVEVFETVHFTLFFVMLSFVIQVLVLLQECNETIENWYKMEADSRDPCIKDKIKTLAIEREMKRRKMNPNTRRRGSILNKVPALRNEETEVTEDHFLFDSLRDEFLKDRSIEQPFQEADKCKRLSEDDFNFARYLTTCLSDTCSKVINVSASTWIFFAVLTIAFYVVDISFNESTKIVAALWVCTGYLFVCFNIAFENHLVSVSKALAWNDAQLERMGLKEVNTSMGESEKDYLLSGEDNKNLPSWCRIDMEDYMKNRSWLTRLYCGKRKPTRQHALMWMESKGPKMHITILQINLVFVGVYVAMLILTYWPIIYHNSSIFFFILFVVLSIVPALALVMNKKRLVATITKVGSVGVMRKHPAVARTIREEKTARAVRALIFLYKVNRLSAQEHTQKKSTGVHYRQSLNKVEIDDVSKTFDTFDESGDGEISHDEFEALMTRFVGNAVNTDSVKQIIHLLDEDGDGGISKEEFLQWYADNMGDDGLSVHEKAHYLFGMFDKEGDGQISIGEFKDALDALNLGFTIDEIGEIVRELDEDGDGVVSQEEFAELIEEYYPKELETEE